MNETNAMIGQGASYVEMVHDRKALEAHPRAGDAGRARWYTRAVRIAVRGIFRVFFRVRAMGLENVPPTSVIICSNHLGWADPFLVLLFLPAEPRIYVLGLHPRRVSAFRARVVDALGVMVALDPAGPRQALRETEDVLKRGGSLLVFPEGTAVGGEEGAILELQHGASHLSQRTGIPILPVGLTGTKELWLRRTLTMRAGQPISPAWFEGDPRTRTRAMTAWLGEELRALLPGDHERARHKPLQRWLTGLFY